MSVTLYQFPISHFCEKVRWALDYKEIPYQAKNLLPGLHVKTMTKLAKRSSVPVLDHEGTAIQNSADIIDYLEQQFPHNPLMPNDPEVYVSYTQLCALDSDDPPRPRLIS